MKVLAISALAIGLLSPPLIFGGQTPPPGVVSDSRPTKIVSPSVVATTMIKTLNGKSSLNVMVLWRGAAGWYLKEGSRASGGRSSEQSIQSRVQWAGANLLVDWERQSGAVRIQGQPVALQPSNANVILVDGVDTPTSKVVGTLRVNPEMPDDKSIEPLLKQSMQIVKFLQCDQPVTNSLAQAGAVRTCNLVTGK